MQYYVFEAVKTQYYNKSGKLVAYSQTVWVDKNYFIENIINQLQLLVRKYILCFFFRYQG